MSCQGTFKTFSCHKFVKNISEEIQIGAPERVALGVGSRLVAISPRVELTMDTFVPSCTPNYVSNLISSGDSNI